MLFALAPWCNLARSRTFLSLTLLRSDVLTLPSIIERNIARWSKKRLGPSRTCHRLRHKSVDVPLALPPSNEPPSIVCTFSNVLKTHSPYGSSWSKECSATFSALPGFFYSRSKKAGRRRTTTSRRSPFSVLHSPLRAPFSVLRSKSLLAARRSPFPVLAPALSHRGFLRSFLHRRHAVERTEYRGACPLPASLSP